MHFRICSRDIGLRAFYNLTLEEAWISVLRIIYAPTHYNSQLIRHDGRSIAEEYGIFWKHFETGNLI